MVTSPRWHGPNLFSPHFLRREKNSRIQKLVSNSAPLALRHFALGQTSSTFEVKFHTFSRLLIGELQRAYLSSICLGTIREGLRQTTVFIKRLLFPSSTLCYVTMFRQLTWWYQIISFQCTALKFTEYSKMFVIGLLVAPFEKQHKWRLFYYVTHVNTSIWRSCSGRCCPTLCKMCSFLFL